MAWSTEHSAKKMESALYEMAERLETGTIKGMSFESAYGAVYNGIMSGHGRVWSLTVAKCARRLILAFRKQRIQYKFASVMVRDVSMFAENTYCRRAGNGLESMVVPTFERIEKEWDGHQELRAFALWHRVRKHRAKILFLSFLMQQYTEVSFRFGHSGYKRCRSNFEECVIEQYKKGDK